MANFSNTIGGKMLSKLNENKKKLQLEKTQTTENQTTVGNTPFQFTAGSGTIQPATQNIFGKGTPVYNINSIMGFGANKLQNQMSLAKDMSAAKANGTQAPTITNLKPSFNLVTQANDYMQDQMVDQKTQLFSELYDAFDDAIRNNKQVTPQKIGQIFPEYKGSITSAMQLYNDMKDNIQNNRGKNIIDYTEYYQKRHPELFKTGLERDENYTAITEDRSQFANDMYNLDLSEDKYNNLSKEGKKYYELGITIKSLANTLRDVYGTDENMNDYDLIAQYAQQNPDIVASYFGDLLDADPNKLKPYDKKILSGDNGFTIADLDLIKMFKKLGQSKVGQKWQSMTEFWNEKDENGDFVQKDPLTRGVVNSINSIFDAVKNVTEGGGNLIEKAASKHFAKLGNKIEGEGTFSPDEFVHTDTTVVDDLTDLVWGGMNVAFWSKSPIFMNLLNTALSSKPGEQSVGKVFERSTNAMTWLLQNTPGVKERYAEQNEDTQEKLANIFTIAITAGLLKGLGKTKGGKTVKAYIGEVNRSVKNALGKGIENAKFQRFVEQGAGNRRTIIDPETGAEIGTEFESYNKGAEGRIRGAFGEGLKEGFRESRKGAKERVQQQVSGKTPTENPALEDQRTIGEKVESKVNDIVDKVSEKVSNIKPTEIIQNASNTIGKIVKGATEGVNKGVESVKSTISDVNTVIKDTLDSIKNYAKENIVEPYREGANLNNKQVQDTQTIQPEKSSGLADINQSNNTNVKGEINSKPLNTVQEQVLQNYNRMNPKAINTFKERYNQNYGQWLADRGFTQAGEPNLDSLVEYKKNLMELKTEALNQIEGRFKDKSVEDMLNHVVEYATNTKSPELDKYLSLLEKYNRGGLSMSEINDIRKYFSYKIRTGFFKDGNSEKVELANNEYMAVKKFLDKVGKENGLDSLDMLNKEISATEHIIGGITYKLQGSSANNSLGLNDYIMLGSVISNPEARPVAVTKLALKNDKFRNMILNAIVGRKGNAKNRITKEKLSAELDKIDQINDVKRKAKLMQEFADKYLTPNTLKALGMNTPIAEIGENGPKISKPNTPQPTVKKVIEINKPQIEKPKPQGLSQLSEKLDISESKAEQVQDSIQDFLSEVNDNGTKPDFDNITTADYKSMSTRALEDLQKSKKVPFEEKKKIVDELATREVKEDNAEGWDYLDHKYAYEIQKLQEEEQRIGKVGNKKVGKEYATKQEQERVKKKESLKEDMKQAYGNKDNERVEDKYSELEGKSLKYIEEWTKSKRFVVDAAEQEIIGKLRENRDKINDFEIDMSSEEKQARTDLLDKINDGYEVKTTNFGDSFVDKNNRSNKGIIYWGDKQVNVNSLETLKNSGLYDVLPEDMNVYVSGSEKPVSIGELKEQKNDGLAKINRTQEEQEVEGLAKINEKIAEEESKKIAQEEGEKATLKDKAEAQDYFDEQEGLGNITKYQKVNSRQTNTPEFKKWFGDSKVVKADGKPQIVYHGTPADFTIFNKVDGAGIYGNGYYFTDKIGTAKGYGADGGKVMKVYLSIKNPYEATHKDEYMLNIDKLKEQGYDGVKAKLGNETYWVAFDPEQIKSATDNIGTFDATNPDIRYQKGSSTITPKQIKELVNQLKKTGLAKDVKMYKTQAEFEQAIKDIEKRLQSVRHGSPYSFTKFDSAHMGEGEGAQAHGWGHYVSVNKKIAKENYADRGGEPSFTYKGRHPKGYLLDASIEDKAAYDLIQQLGYWAKDYKTAVKDLKERYAETANEKRDHAIEVKEKGNTDLADILNGNADKYDEMIRILDSFKEKDFKYSENRHLYELEIPDYIKEGAPTPTGKNYIEEEGRITKKQWDIFREEVRKIDNSKKYHFGDGTALETIDEWTPGDNGFYLYRKLSNVLGGDKEASVFLSDLGYDGIHYKGGTDGECYVIFGDNALSITDHIQYLKDAKGDIAGATTPDGTVHLIESNLRGDTPTHEFSHLLRSYAKENSPELFNAINKIAKEAPKEVKDYVKRTYGDLSEDAFLDEVFAWRQGRYSGIKGAQSWYQRMREAIKRIWNNIKSRFGKEYANLDVFKAREKMGSMDLMKKVDNLLKGGKKIGEGKGKEKMQVSKTKDSQGRNLTAEQQDYFANSVIRNEKGELIPLYHGTAAKDFTVFKMGKNGESNTLAKVGYWFSPSKEGAENFAKESFRGDGDVRSEEVYLNIKNPKIYEPRDINLLDEKTREAKISEQWEIYRKKKGMADSKDYTQAGGMFDDEFEHNYHERAIFDNLKRKYENEKQYDGKLGKYDPEEFRELAELYNSRDNAGIDYDKIVKDFTEYEKLQEEAEIEHDKYQEMAWNDPYEDFQYDIYKVDRNMDNRWTRKDIGMALNDYNSPTKYVEQLKAEGYDGIIIKGTDYDGNVFGGKNDQYIAFYSNQIKRTSNLNPTKNEDITLQTVYHGGGDFKKFDLSHVGEGEGNQAHGYGHYFTENKSRAQEYANLYRNNKYGFEGFGDAVQFVSYKGNTLGKISGEYSHLINEIIEGMQNRNEAYPYYDAESQIARAKRGINIQLNKFMGQMSEKEFNTYKKSKEKEIAFLDSLDPKDFKIEKTKQNLYDVDIPNTKSANTPTRSNYLEEEQVLSKEEKNLFKTALLDRINGDKYLLGRMSDYMGSMDGRTKITGKELYKRISSVLGGNKQASEFFQSLGYDGIHYIGELDGSSYVIFDNDPISILEHARYQKIGGLSNTQIKKFAKAQGLADISNGVTKEYTVKNGKVQEVQPQGLANISNGIRYQLAEGSIDNIDAYNYEQKILANKRNLRSLADTVGMNYRKHDGGYTIDDALEELDEINHNKKNFPNESDIKRVKRDQIKEIIDAIDNGYGGDWNYDWFFDNKREYQWMPTVIFWKGNDLREEVLNNRVISFHQLKNRNGYRHVPTGRLPLSPIRMKAAGTL